MSFSNVGQVWSKNTLVTYLRGKKPPVWATSVTLHHTAAPSLAQRPGGFTAQHIKNIQHFYQKQLGWSRGPHFFIDEDQVWGMTPPTVRGVHAKSFNASSIGIEVLGNYDVESPDSGRGKQCWETAAAATKALLDWLGVSPDWRTVYFHRDDPRTSKSCPGKLVSKDVFLEMVKSAVIDPEAAPELGPVLTGIASTDLVGIVDFVSEKLKKPYREVVAGLKRQGKEYYLFDKWVERAFYDKERKTTVAPRSELEQILFNF